MCGSVHVASETMTTATGDDNIHTLAIMRSLKLFMRSKYDANGRKRFIQFFNGNVDLFVT